jgi:hypothetical protein
MSFIYELFRSSISNIVNKQTEDIQLHKLLELQAAFINFCVHTYPDKVQYVDQILKISVTLCSKVNPTEYTDVVLDNIVQILTFPLETMSIVVLNLSEYPNLMNYLPYLKRKYVATKIVEAIINTRTYLIDVKNTSKLIGFIQPLLEDSSDTVSPTAKEMESEMGLLAKLLYFVESHDPIVTYKMLSLFEAKIVKFPIEWKRFALPSVMTYMSRVALRVQQVAGFLTQEDAEEKIIKGYDRLAKAPYLSEAEKENFNFKVESVEFDFLALFTKLRDYIEELAIDFPETGIKLGLELARLVNKCDTPEKVYQEFQADLCNETLEVFQDEISDPKAKVSLVSNRSITSKASSEL